MQNELEYNILITEIDNFVDNIVKKKYCINDEKTYDDVLKRYKNELSKIIPNKNTLDRICSMLEARRYFPAGSIAYGLGNTNSKSSLSNCYFTPIEEDSIEGIFECAKKMARTYSYRGGSGTDISILRPKNSPVRNAARFSTGSISFLSVFNEVTEVIGQEGRRGAMIATLDIRHPDIPDFIWCKSKPEKVFKKDNLTGKIPNLSGMNISIKLTDKFIDAVKKNKDWTFIFPDTKFEKYNSDWKGDYDEWINKGYPVKEYNKINAKELLKQIAESCWISGDPGISYWDTVQNYSLGLFDERLKVRGNNPCAEQPLGAYNNCLLSALVLYKYVNNPYQLNAEFDNELFLEDVKHGIIFLDSLIDINTHPLQEQRDADQYGRRVGQEFTGLADMLAMLGHEYGSEESYNIIDSILFRKAVVEIKTSLELAKEKGCAPALKSKISRKKFLNQPYMISIFDRILPTQRELLKNEIMEHGLRNCNFNTVGPAGSISILAGNCTSGIEPLYQLEYNRESRVQGSEKIRILHYPLLKEVGPSLLSMKKEDIKKKYNYKETNDIDYKDRIKIQSVVQRWIDASVSSTINLSNDCTIEDIFNIYLEGHKQRLKGITIFRDGCKKGILTSVEEKKETVDHEGTLLAYRHAKQWKNTTVYLIVSVDNNDKPQEVFASVPYEAGFENNGQYNPQLFNEHLGYWNTICRLVSLCLRSNIKLDKIIRQLEKSTPNLTDLTSIVRRALQKFANANEESKIKVKSGEEKGYYCYICKKYTAVFVGGCKQCLNCGDSGNCS